MCVAADNEDAVLQILVSEVDGAWIMRDEDDALTALGYTAVTDRRAPTKRWGSRFVREPTVRTEGILKRRGARDEPASSQIEHDELKLRGCGWLDLSKLDRAYRAVVVERSPHLAGHDADLAPDAERSFHRELGGCFEG